MTVNGGRESHRIPLFTAIGTYFGYGLLMMIGHIRDFFHHLFFGKQTTAPKVRCTALTAKPLCCFPLLTLLTAVPRWCCVRATLPS